MRRRLVLLPLLRPKAFGRMAYADLAFLKTRDASPQGQIDKPSGRQQGLSREINGTLSSRDWQNLMRQGWHVQAKGTTLTMAWSILPDDVAELILGKLSLVRLGRVSTTCRSFHAFFCRRMAEQQKAHCDLAVKWMGRERVTLLADVVDGFLKGETLGATTPDGVLVVDDPFLRSLPGPEPLEAGCIEVRYQLSFSNDMYVRVRTPNQAWVHLRAHRDDMKVVITIHPNQGEVGLEGVSLVHALLALGLSPKHDAWPHADVKNFRMKWGPTSADVEAEVAPLLLLVAQHTKCEIKWWHW